MSDEVDFFHADKHDSLLQIDTMILMEMIKHSQSSKNSKFVMYLQCLKKEVRDGNDFVRADKHQSFLEVDFNTLGFKVSCKVILSLLMGMIKKHSRRTESNEFAISLQFSRKKLRIEFIFFHADKHKSFCELTLSSLMEFARHVQST